MECVEYQMKWKYVEYQIKWMDLRIIYFSKNWSQIIHRFTREKQNLSAETCANMTADPENIGEISEDSISG